MEKQKKDARRVKHGSYIHRKTNKAQLGPSLNGTSQKQLKRKSELC